MSALGQKQTSEVVQSMSALPPKADIGSQPRDVRFLPKGDDVTFVIREPPRRRGVREQSAQISCAVFSH
jgi:hypothetical protein